MHKFYRLTIRMYTTVAYIFFLKKQEFHILISLKNEFFSQFHLCDSLPSISGDLPQSAEQRAHHRQVFPEQDRSRTLGQPEKIQSMN